MKRLWPLGCAILLFGVVYCSLLCLFPDAIAAYVSMRLSTDVSTWGGIEDLFVLNSAVLGWVTVVVLDRRTGAVGFVLLLAAIPWCVASIGGGFALSALLLGGLSGPMWEMLLYSLVSVVAASALRSYLAKIQ